MLLTPRYDGPAVLCLETVDDASVPLLRQRRRLASVLSTLTDEQWAAPSRCEGWTVQDVVAHLVGTNQFWTLSLAAGAAGEPTRYLAAFDPVATPAQMVEPTRDMTPTEVLDQYVETLDAFEEVVAGYEGDAWARPAEAPPGHVSAALVALHALWDAWVHERDILLPLDIEQQLEADEVVRCLRYASAIGPTLLATIGSTRTGALCVNGTDPDVVVVIHAGRSVTIADGPAPTGTPELMGGTVELIEGLTLRRPLAHDLGDEHGWLVSGLDQAFDVATSG